MTTHWPVPLAPGACCAGLCLLLLVGGPAMAWQAPPTPPAEAELHRLANEDLVKQAQARYSQASGGYLAELRGLAAAQRQLEQAREAAAQFTVPDKPSVGPEKLSPLEKARLHADQTRLRLEAVKRRLALLQAEKSRADRYAAQVNLARSAANAFIEALGQLDAFRFELDLRVRDGSLRADAVPASLDPAALGKRKEELAELLRDLAQKADAASTAQKQLATRLDEATKAVLDAEAEAAAASKSHAQQLKQSDVEKQYAGVALDQLRAQLGQLQEERASLKGAFNLSHGRFQQAQAGAGQLREQLDSQKESTPDAGAGQVNRAEDYDRAAKAAEVRIQFHTARLSRLKELTAALLVVLQRAGALEGDAAVLDEHLFRMQVLGQRILKAGKTELPDGARPEQLLAEAARVRAQLSAAQAIAGTARSDAVKVAELEIASRRTLTEVKERHDDLKKAQESTRQAAQWEAQLKALKADAVLERLVSNTKELQEQLATLSGQRLAYKKATTAIGDIKRSLGALKDPVRRQAEEETAGEKQRLSADLHKLAEIDGSVEGGPAPADAPGTPAGPKPPAPPASGGPPLKPALPGYSQLLSAHVRILDEQEKARGEMLRALDALKTTATEYARHLANARRLALQQHATAIELKKRLGRGELEGKTLPDSVGDGLKRDQIDQLGKESTDLLAEQARVSAEREQLDRPDEAEKAMHARVREAHELLEKRSDLLQQMKGIEEEFKRERKSLSEGELKTLEETARRRQRADNSFWDDAFGFAPSEDALRLSELLRSYYMELIELEGKQEQLAAQLERARRADRLAQEESVLLEKLLPLLHAGAGQVEGKKEEELVLARARLKPKEADELLKSFEAKTGRRLPPPAPCADAERPAVVREAAGRAADLEAQALAGRKWARVVEERLAPAGIKAEIGEYQDRLATLNASTARVQRRIQALTGASEDEAAATKGIIAVTRGEQFSARRSSGLRILVTVFAVFLVGFVLTRVVDFVLGRFQKARPDRTPHSLFLSSFLRVFLRVTIWITCLVVALSTLGFSVAAILAGMGIGGLAIGLAAKGTLEDMISGMVLFMERPFAIGDTLQIGSAPPARVVGMTWRTTRLQDSFGYYTNVPNSKVAASTIQNFTRDGIAVDYLTVNVPARHEVSKVIRLMENAIAECPSIAKDRGKGVILAGLESVSEGGGGVMKYLPWWHVQDYNNRHLIRHELSELIWKQFVKAGIVEAQVAV